MSSDCKWAVCSSIIDGTSTLEASNTRLVSSRSVRPSCRAVPVPCSFRSEPAWTERLSSEKGPMGHGAKHGQRILQVIGYPSARLTSPALAPPGDAGRGWRTPAARGTPGGGFHASPPRPGFILVDSTTAQEDQARGVQSRQVQIVKRQQYRQSPASIEAGEGFQQLHLVMDVQISRGFVQNQQVRFLSHGGDQGALSLSARQLREPPDRLPPPVQEPEARIQMSPFSLPPDPETPDAVRAPSTRSLAR